MKRHHNLTAIIGVDYSYLVGRGKRTLARKSASCKYKTAISLRDFNRNTGMHMATARPVHGDTFDRAVGVAVAYAKAIGMTIPDFI